MSVQNGSDHYSAVFEALDSAAAGSPCLASSEARIQRALAHFRHQRSDPAAIRQLEQASVELNRLHLASLANLHDIRLVALDRLRKAARTLIERNSLQ